MELSQSGKPALPADVSELLIPPYSRLPGPPEAEGGDRGSAHADRGTAVVGEREDLPGLLLGEEV